MIEESELELFERSLRQAVQRHTGPALDAALAELGWIDALGTDREVAISALFPLQGSANAASGALGWVLAAELGAASGSTPTIVLPVLGGWAPPGTETGDDVAVRGVLASPPPTERRAFVVVANPTGRTTTSITVDLDQLTTRRVEGIDPAAGLVEVSGRLVLDSRAQAMTGEEWDRAVALGQLAVGYEIVGASRTMLELARDHAMSRVQFGQPIARFQAVRHRLAETLVAIDAADAMLASALADPSPLLAANAKALAGRSGRIAARHCQQVLAGMGFTSAHPFQRYFKRVLVLDELLGSTKRLTRAVGEQLLAERNLPLLLPL